MRTAIMATPGTGTGFAAVTVRMAISWKRPKLRSSSNAAGEVGDLDVVLLAPASAVPKSAGFQRWPTNSGVSWRPVTVLVVTVAQVCVPTGRWRMRMLTVLSAFLPGGSFWMWQSPRGKVNSTASSSAFAWRGANDAGLDVEGEALLVDVLGVEPERLALVAVPGARSRPADRGR